MFLNDEVSVYEKDINKSFPWIGKRRIRLPNGWYKLLENACYEIEAVISPEKPMDKFQYFFATVRDYKLQLYLQYDFEDGSGAKESAIESLIQDTRSISASICAGCGSKLITKNHNYDSLPDCGCVAAASNVENKEKSFDKNSSSLIKMVEEDILFAKPDETNQPEGLVLQSINKESNSITVFDINKAKELLENVGHVYRDKSDANSVRTTLNKLIKLGPSKTIKHIPCVLNELEQNFPNFIEVIDMLKCVQALSRDSTMAKIPPTLLLGPPGLGKTMFAQALAESMGVPFKVVRMENQQAGAGLIGSSDFWSNSKSGLVFNLLTNETCGNPLIVLDEVDKANVNSQYNPMNSLYNLLENSSAKSFNDESLPDLILDASKITWILTANYIEDIPEAILSRMRIFKIPMPDSKQARSITIKIYNNILNESDLLKSKFDRELSEEVIKHLSSLSPRKIKLFIETALGKAAIANRSKLITEDIKIETDEKFIKLGFI